MKPRRYRNPRRIMPRDHAEDKHSGEPVGDYAPQEEDAAPVEGKAPTDGMVVPDGWRDCRTERSPNRKPRPPKAARKPRDPDSEVKTGVWVPMTSQREADYLARIAELEERGTGTDHSASLSIMALLRHNHEQVAKLLKACERELEDPRKKGSYTLQPHASECTVTFYTEVVRGRGTALVRQSETLQALLDASGVTGRAVGEVRVKTASADPRELLLKCVNAHHSTAEMLMQVAKYLSDAVRVQRVERMILDVIASFDAHKAAECANAIARLLASLGDTEDIAAGYIEGEVQDA